MSKLIPLVLLLACPAFSGTLIDTAHSPVSFEVGAAHSLSTVSFLTEAWERLSQSISSSEVPTQDLAAAAEESLLDRLLRASLLF